MSLLTACPRGGTCAEPGQAGNRAAFMFNLPVLGGASSRSVGDHLLRQSLFNCGRAPKFLGIEGISSEGITSLFLLAYLRTVSIPHHLDYRIASIPLPLGLPRYINYSPRIPLSACFGLYF